jgi:hypothetical protein
VKHNGMVKAASSASTVAPSTSAKQVLGNDFAKGYLSMATLHATWHVPYIGSETALGSPGFHL